MKEHDFYTKYKILDTKSIFHRVTQSKKSKIFKDLQEGGNEEIGLLEDEALKSLIYIPMISDENEVFGIIRIGINNSSSFGPEERIIVELISNSVGITIRNSMLQDILRNKRTEIDFINGAISEHGRRNRVPTPINDVLTGLIRTLEHKNIN